MISSKLTVMFPKEFIKDNEIPREIPRVYNKLAVIKAIRILTGWYLKEARDASENIFEPVVLPINNISQNQYDECLNVFRNNGVEILKDDFSFTKEEKCVSENYSDMVRDTLRGLASEGIKLGEYDTVERLIVILRSF